MQKKDIIFLIYTLILISLFIYQPTRQFIESATISHPYLLGMIKTSILATSGELIASRIMTKNYFPKSGLILRFIVWGFLGLTFVLMFEIYGQGVDAALANKLLPSFQFTGFIRKLWRALLTSAIMNLTFAPAFMLLHRVTDSYIDLTKGKLKKIPLNKITNSIQWKNYFEFVILKTIPFFWIPAHTITFLLPKHYRVLMAGILSIALGLILSLSNRKQSKKGTVE